MATSSSKVYQQISDNIRARAQGKEPYKPYKIQTSYGSRTVGEQEYLRKVEERRQELEQEKLRKRQEEMKARGYTTREQQLVYNQIQDAKDYVAAIRRQQMSEKLKSAGDSIVTGGNKPAREKAAGISRQVLSDISKNLGLKIQNEQNVINNQGRAEDDPARLRAQEELGKLQDRQTAVWMKQNAAQQGGKKQEIRTLPGTYTKEAKEALHDRDSGLITSQDDYVKWMMQGADAGLLDKDKEKQVRQYAFYYNAPDAKNSREYSEYFRNGIESGIFDEGNDLGMQSTGKLQSDLDDLKRRKAQAENNSRNSDEINSELYKTLGSQGAYKNLEMNGLYDPFTDEYHLKKPGDYNEWDVRDRSGETRELSTYYDSLLYDSIHGEGAYNNILNNGTDAEFDAADAEVQDLWARLENGTIGQLGDQYNDRISELQGAAYGGESNLDREIRKRQEELTRRETIGKYSGMEGAAYNPNLINQETAEKYRTNLMVNQGDAGPQGNKTEWLYWLINNVSGAEHDYGEGFLGELTNVQQAEQSYRKYSFMTDEMIGQFNALYEAGKTKEAQAFMDAIDPYISQMAAGRAEELRYNASKGMFGGLYGAMTILRQPVAGLEGTIGSLAAIFGNEDAKNPNSNWYRLQRMNSTTRGARAETWGDFFANSFGEEYRGAGEWLNGVTYSIADNLMAMALTKGAGKAFGYDMASKSATRVMQFIMSSGAASSTMVQKLNDGMDPTEAAIYAVGNGIIEAITEKYSIEALLKPNVREMLGKPSQILKYLGKNTLAEATEEGASNLLGTTFDQLMSAVFNHESELESQYNQLISKGMSEKDASRQVWNNWGETLLSEMMAGGLSGFFLSAGNVAQNTVRQAKTGAQIRSKGNVIGSKTGADQLIEAAKGMNEGTQSRELAEGISEKAEKGKKASNYELGRLAQNIIEESTEEIGNIAQDTVQRMVEESLKEQGVSPETISIVAPMITQAAVKGNAGILSRAQMAEIAKSKPAIETLRSFVSNAGKVGVNMVTGIAAEKPLAIRQAVADLMKGGKASTTISGVFAGNVAQARKTADIATKEDMEGLKGKARNNGLDAIWNGEIVQITGKSNGKIDILRENGEHTSVNADELTAAGEAMATLLNYTNMYKGVLGDSAFSALTAEILNNKDLDGTKFVSEALRAYIGFRTGNPITTSALSDKTMEQIRKAAETAAEEARQARLKAGEAYEKAEPGKGALMFDGAEYGTDAWKQKIKKAGLSHDQRNQAAALGEMIRRLGVRVDLINVDNNDMFGYEDSKGRLYINIGAKDESGSGQHLLTVASHELTHWLEHTSDTGYAELREFVLDQLRKRGANIEAMVASTIDQYRQVVKQDLSIEGALAEIVANACDQVLANENTAKALNEEHPDLYKKVKGFAKNFLERVKAATNYSRESTLNTSVESRILWNEGKGQKVLDEIARIYMGARQEALSRQEARTGAEGKEPEAQLSIRQLSAQDKAYADAVKRGDIQAATDMLMDKLAESENIIPFNAPNWYAGEHADVAQLIKTGTPEAIARAAASMASYVPDNGVLVPMPNHHGQVSNDTDTMILAKAIGELTNRPVIAALEGADRESRYTSKAAGGKGIQAEEMGFRQVKEIPEGTVPIFVDNVVGSGVTAQAAREAMGGGITLAYAKSVRSKGIEGLKRATVTYDRNGELIPLSQRFNPNVRNINYSVRQAQEEAKQITDTDGNQILNISDTGSVTQYSYRSYITEDQRGKVMRLLKKMGFSEEEIVKWMKDLDEVASIIEADPTRLDYTPDRGQKYKKPNGDVYKWTLDASSLCAKRLLYQGTFNEIQKQLPNTPLRPGDLIDLVNMMHEMGYITPCGICYVESRRRHTGNAIEKFLADYKGDFKPNYADLASTDGLAKLKSEHPDTYKAFIKAMNKRGAGSIKLVQLRTDYRGDLRSMKKDTVNYLNHIGGIRIQSFSDFETPHMLDLMQAVVDMKIKGLKSQAYTKVPNFAWVFGDTGIKINLSLMGEGTGVDKNGKLIFSSTEGMRIDQAMMLRTKYSKNVGTILVGMSVEHIKAAMADPRIDFIIPFHKSGWSAEEFEKMTTLQGYNDFEAWQNERVISGTTASGELTYKNVGTNIEPDEYWDYTEGVTGKQNAENYLKLCAERGVVPKFDFLLDDNGDGSYSLPEDGSADGYWKLLIDYKMYDNDGHPAEQQVVDTNFNMEEARRILADYKGGADTLPVAEPVVERYVQYYKDKHPLTGGKTQYSIRQDSEGRQLTPEQQEYFRYSKAVDKEGRLLQLYHGTRHGGFRTFNNKRGTYWFTDSRETARTYSQIVGDIAPSHGEELDAEDQWLEEMNGGIFVSYLNMKDPEVIDAKGARWDSIIIDGRKWTTDELADRANQEGYDGLIINNIKDEGDYRDPLNPTYSNVYTVFSPEQIKSINNTEPTENPDIRFSIRQGDMEINRWMQGLTASSLQTEQERTMLKQWKATIGSLELARHALYGYKSELSKLEAKPNPTAYEKHQMTVLRDRIEAWQKKVDRYETSLAKATSEKGFAAIMRKQSRIMNDLVNGRTADEVRGTVDAINAELETVQKEMEARKERLKQLAAKEAVIRIRQQLNSAGLKRIAAKLKNDLNSELSNTEIENRLALMALKMKEGNIDEEDVTELADMLIGKMCRTYDSYILDELRGRTITLSQSQQKELKGQNRTIREIRQELAGTGIRIDTKGGNTLDKNWSELCDLIPALNREAADKDMLDQLLNVIAAEKEAARNQYTANMDMEVASMVIDAASNLVPEIVTDKKSMQLIRETLNFIAEMSTEAEESAKALEELNSLMARLQKKGGEAKSTLGKLESNIHDAIAYNNELSTQSEQANWLTERHKLIDQLKSEHTQEMLRQQAEFKLKIEKDKAARGLMNENMALRRRINTNILRVRNLLMKESVKQNVPEHMKGLAREMLDLIVRNDMSGRKITGMDLKMLQETRRVLDAWEAQDGKYSPDQLKGLDEAVQDAVYNALEDIKAGIDFYNASTKGSELTVNLQAFKNALTRISDGVSEIIGIINAERSIALGDRRVAVEDQAYKVQESAGDRRAKVLTGRLGQTITTLRKAITSGNLTPEYFFKMLKNEGLDDLWEEYHRAENRNGLELAKAKGRLDEIAQKHGYKKWDTNARKAVKLESGTVNMTLGQIMSLYATWKREHTLGPAMSNHLQGGGFYVEEYDPREGIIGRREVDLKAHRVTEADMAMVNGLLTDEQKQFVDDIVAYMSTDMSELGNDASMKAYGIRMYKESYYFPFKMWDGIRARASNDSGSAAAANDRAFHPSFSKTRLHGANNALMLGDFMTTAADHIVGMINYATMGLANENLQKVLNAQVPEGERLDQMTRRTIRTVLEEAYGRTMTEYLAKLQEQLNGGVGRVDRTVYDRMLTLFRKNAVAGSMSVALQQPLSYIRAAMMINPKYMTEALAREYWQGSYQERMKHSGISVIKDMGRFDMGFGQGAREYITPDGKEGKIRKVWDAVTDKATILPELMDRWTWNRLWVAVKAEQHDLYPDMDVKSDAFLDMVGERFNDIVRKTQVYDSTLTKSQNMRSQNPFVKSITSFMAEPTLSLNVLADAVQNAKEKGGKLKLAKALATFALSAMAQAAAKALMSTGRSPDEKKTWKENYLYRYYANMISEADPMNLIPGYNDLITLLKDGKLEDDAMGVLGKLFTAGDKLAGMFKAGAGYREIEDGAGQIIQLLTQLPAKNIMRDLRAMYNWFIGKPYADRETSAAVIRLQTEASLMTADNLLGVIMAKLGEAGYKVTNSAYYDRMYSAYQRGDQQGAEAIREYLTLGKGVDESQIDSNMRTMTRKGNLFPALEANKAAEIAAAIKDLQKFGAEVKDIKSAITKEMKPKYLAADAAGKVKIRDAIQKAYKAMGLTAEDADKVINGWKEDK